jgi:hypothetical protein
MWCCVPGTWETSIYVGIGSAAYRSEGVQDVDHSAFSARSCGVGHVCTAEAQGQAKVASSVREERNYCDDQLTSFR